MFTVLQNVSFLLSSCVMFTIAIREKLLWYGMEWEWNPAKRTDGRIEFHYFHFQFWYDKWNVISLSWGWSCL